MKLSIITLNFKKPLLTTNCIRSLHTTYEKQFAQGEFELIIVDNFSNDQSVEILEREIKVKKYSHTTVISSKENNGFGAGNNLGAESAKGEYVLFLNNDTIVGQGIEKMVEFLDRHKEVGIVGGPLRNTDGTTQSSAGSFYTPFRVLLLLLGLQRFGLDTSPTVTSQVDWVKGALLMIRKTVFEKLHGFDERIFMYTEDMELCYRAHLLGEQVYFFQDVDVIHEDQGSSNRTFAIIHIYDGILYFYKKHKSRLEFFVVKLMLQTKAIFLVSLGVLTRNSYLTTTYEKALSVCR